MVTIPDFEIKEIILSDGIKTVCRAVRRQDGQGVVLKIISGEFPGMTESIKLRREYELARKLDFPGVPMILDISEFYGGLAIVMEDFGGEALSVRLKKSAVPVDEFLPIAHRLATILCELHRRDIIHKDIKPDNILVHSGTGEVQLIDFGIAVMIAQETVGAVDLRQLEGSLPYISPEQTGRMNLPVDYRTDFYSLGITFYQMLAGRLPFFPDDPVELLHAHLARQPQSLVEIVPAIPPVLEALIFKLLDKSPDRRYQSANGLKTDLEQCIRMYEKKGNIEDFTLASMDRSDRFRIPQKLYGREQEVHFLLETYEEAARGKAKYLLVSGYSGIGKSSLIREIHKPIVASRGHFASGKFDQFNRNTPYSAVITAFQNLMRQLLSESDEKIAMWRNRLHTALGANGRVIADVIPEVQLIIGEQAEVATLPPSESQNRFNLVFLEFVQALAMPEHPLVLFLDDLQWADTPSLKLIEVLLSDKETAWLLLIGAYRNNEVDATHPLARTLQELKKSEDTVVELLLKPLQINELNQLVADTVHCSSAEALPLSELLLEKTGGNPFFANEFLKSLHTDQLIVFDHLNNRWDWDIEKIRERNITDNVVELMRNKIQLLDEHTQHLCRYAACIGNKFDLFTLATVGEKSPQATARKLWPAIREGLIVPIGSEYRLAEISAGMGQLLNSEYRFLHDQVQHAAYALLDNESKRSLHLKIGRLMLQNFTVRDKNDRIFELATQFNHGATLIEEDNEKITVAELNLTAGKKAKNAAAYEPAFRYLMTGIQLLPQDAWQRYYDLTLDMYNECAEAAYLSGNTDEMERLTDVVFGRAAQLLHKVKAYTVKIQGYLSLTRNEEALNTCLEIMRMLGVRFPVKPNKLDIVKSLIATKLRLRGKTADQLVSLPEMTDPKAAALMEILPYAASSSYFAKPNLFPLIVFKQLSLSVRYGNHEQSAFAYATYGLVMCGSTLEYDEGLKFGEIAIRLLDKFRAVVVFTRTHFVNAGFIQHWRHHFRETLDELLEAYQKGLETGDFTYGSYSVFNYCSAKFYMGAPLPALKNEMDAYIPALQKIQQNTAIGWLNIPRQTISNLLDEKQAETRLLGPEYDENIETAQHLAGKDFSGLCVYYMARTMLSYLFDSMEEALENGEAAVRLLENVLATPHVSTTHYFYALALLRSAEKATAGKKRRHLKKAGQSIHLVKKFAASAPSNHLAKKQLLEAETRRLQGRSKEAALLYQEAISAARQNGFLHEEAIAHELAARFWQEQHDTEKSRQHLLQARHLFQNWGAVAKVNHLDQQYSILTPLLTRAANTTTRSGVHSSDELDMLSLTKAALAISGEIQLDKLMTKLMHVVVENAGAQFGYLVIEREGQWLIETSGSVENITQIEKAPLFNAVPLNGSSLVPESVIQYVARTREDLVINDMQQDNRFAGDPVVLQKKTRSALCLPVINQGKIIGILYAENNLNAGVFTGLRVQFMKLLSGQVAVSLENALQYERLEQKVKERTAEVVQQKEALEKSLTDLKMAQAKLVESEKMASLGQLTAGIAHEINNPINFVSVGVKNLVRNFEEAREVMDAYLNPAAEPDVIAQQLAEKQRRQQILEIFEDSETLFKSIQNGVERTISIVKSLRNFSRLDEGDFKRVDIHEGLDSTLEILQGQIRKKAEIVKKYGQLPLIECAAGKINQVFLNIINNALQAIPHHGVITLETNFLEDSNEIEINISDTGQGMTEEVKRRLFEPFFTTKPVGEGTGLGLSISYNIIEEHKGRIEVESEKGEGTTFRIFLPVVPPV
ncbi:MAG: GAF domain-containing protein [Haliscomenobacteraceae bacterium CHB4]|nr:GAF domain-containing protein [Haliscomenobacteraceae bacterium CHB4]